MCFPFLASGSETVWRGTLGVPWVLARCALALVLFMMIYIAITLCEGVPWKYLVCLVTKAFENHSSRLVFYSFEKAFQWLLLSSFFLSFFLSLFLSFFLSFCHYGYLSWRHGPFCIHVILTMLLFCYHRK